MRSEERIEARLAGASSFLRLAGVSLEDVRTVLTNTADYWVPFKHGQRRGVRPRLILVVVQEKLLAAMLLRISIHQSESDSFVPAVATAFAKGDSCLNNARVHMGQRSSLLLDIRRAFPSVKRKHIEAFLRRNGFSRDEAWVFSRVMTFDGRLQQGSAVAPTIFNLLLLRLDGALLDEFGIPWSIDEMADEDSDMLYTRYADDLCFSCGSPEFPEEVEAKIREIIASHHFEIGGSKTRRGSDGTLYFPGVIVHNSHELGPGHGYLRRARGVLLARELDDHKVSRLRELPSAVLAGHRAYILQFDSRYIPMALRRRLGLTRWKNE